MRRVAAPGSLRYLLLVGDAEPATLDPRAQSRCVPTHLASAKVNVLYGSEPEIGTDNWYADLDDDRVPELAVGRLTSDSPAELTTMVRKILDYEQNVDFGMWRRQIHLVAGLGGFGALTDATLEASAKSLITQGVPPAFATTMTYASWQSPYCPDPRRFAQAAQRRLNEGSLFWVYIGHGQARALDEVQVPGGRYPILTSRDATQLHAEHGRRSPVFWPATPARSTCRALPGRRDVAQPGRPGGRAGRIAGDDALCHDGDQLRIAARGVCRTCPDAGPGDPDG